MGGRLKKKRFRVTRNFGQGHSRTKKVAPGHPGFTVGSPGGGSKFVGGDSDDGFGWDFYSKRFIGVSQGDSK